MSQTDSIDNLSDIVQDDDANEGEEEQEEELFEKDSEHPCLVWSGPNKKFPILIFSSDAVQKRDPSVRCVGEKYHLAFKIVKTECKLVKSILQSHGFHETHPNGPDFNLIWTGCHLKPYVLRSLTDYQKVNHFPRSYELTRKDRLYKNVQRLQQLKGTKHFDFMPSSFVFPAEFQDFCSYFLKDKGPYIVKPIASSRGRGIFIINHPDQIPLDEQLVVCKYVDNPLVIDGFKFDLRIYVAVTSYDPLVIYMYEEGLARFATVKYQSGSKFIRNQCMHLTNYSINKKNQEFVQNDDAEVEDFGNKWSLGALLRYLKSEGHDISALMMRLEDIIIKSIISVEMPIATACKMFQPHKGNCFELYGFDIIIDDTLRPWVLEVNLSPSLACDSPLDFKIKCNMISDLFSLVGFVCHDPMLRTLHQSKFNKPEVGSARSRSGSQRPSTGSRPGSASSIRSASGSMRGVAPAQPPMTGDEIRTLRRVKEEFQRRGGWLRVFPTPDTWELYSSFLQTQNPNNLTLHQKLFPQAWRGSKATMSAMAISSKSKVPLHSLQSSMLQVMLNSHADHHRRVTQAYRSASQRTMFYARKIGTPLKRSSAIQRARSMPPDARIKKPVFGPHASKNPFRGEIMKPHLSDDETTLTKDDSDVKEIVDKDSSQIDMKPDGDNGFTHPNDVNGKETGGKPPVARVAVVHKPMHDPDLVIQTGGDMTKIQARQAFASYLSRVQRRLLADQANTDRLPDDDMKLANEQLDLVLRFLKRAASDNFKVVVPSRKLPLSQRQRILAKMLGDFIRNYARDTDHLKLKEVYEPNIGVVEPNFTSFLRIAEESQLETLLTTYTRINKSAGIFISGNSKASDSTQRMQITETGNNGHVTVDVSDVDSDNGANPNHNNRSASPVMSSYRNAVGVYSASPLRRPTSASGHLSRASRSNARPSTSIITAGDQSQQQLNLSSSSNAGNLKSLSTYDDDALNDALQRLAVRQQSRQYAAYKVNSVLSRPVSSDHRLSSSSLRKTSSTSSLTDVYGASQQNKLSSTQDSLMNQIRQSRALLEVSRAKHDAMLAKTHKLSSSSSSKPPRPISVQPQRSFTFNSDI